MQPDSEQDPSKYLSIIIDNDAIPSSADLELALRSRLFKLAIKIMQNGAPTDSVQQWIPKLLSSTIPLNEDFLPFLFILHEKKLINAQCIKTEDLIVSENAGYAMAAFCSFLMNFRDDLESLSSLNVFPEAENIQDSLKSAPKWKIPEILIRQSLISKLNRIRDTTHTVFLDDVDTLKNESRVRRTTELANALTVTAQNLASHTKADTRIPFKKALEALESFLDATYTLPTSRIKSHLAVVEEMQEELKTVVLGATFAKTEFIDKLVESPDILISTPREQFSKVFNSIYHLMFCMCAVNAVELQSVQELKAEYDSVPVMIESLKKEYNDDLKEYPDEAMGLFESSSPIFAAMRKASEAVVTAKYVCECWLLEGIIGSELSRYSGIENVYPKQRPNAYIDIVNVGIFNATIQEIENRRLLLDEIIELATDFCTKTRKIPGALDVPTYRGFVPKNLWKWTEIEGYEFPTEPEKVQTALNQRMELIDIIEGWDNIPHCIRCRQPANVVCPKCKNLVLCKQCRMHDNKCPAEGCGFELEASQ